jgi:multidrug efflux pump subunit AcrB
MLITHPARVLRMRRIGRIRRRARPTVKEIAADSRLLQTAKVGVGIVSPVVILSTSTDIFPSINIPVIAVAWTYSRLSPEETEGRITTVYERTLTTLVDNIQHIESTTVNGTAIVKVYLQPSASIDRANAQVTAVSQTILRQLPPGSLPPLIINYNASTVPILQLGLSGKDLTEPELNDIALNFLRTQLVTVPGAAVLYPSGGKVRQIMINLNQSLLQAKNVSPNDVLSALQEQDRRTKFERRGTASIVRIFSDHSHSGF